MKRQKNGDGATKAEDTTKMRKTSKGVVEKVEEEAKNGVEWPAAAAVAEDSWLGLEEWSVLTREIVDEEMSWGYLSLPIWGVEAYGSSFSDVVWDDDIWNLKSVHEIPANI